MPTNDYEFDMMQEEAIRQAREMFSRASPTEPYFEFEKKQTPDFLPSQNTQKQKPDKYGEQFYSNRLTPNKSGNLFGSFFKDKDIVLILALVLLLSSDGGDRLLILALIYIMS